MHLTPVVPRVSATTPANFLLAPLFVSVSCQYGIVSCMQEEINTFLAEDGDQAAILFVIAVELYSLMPSTS